MLERAGEACFAVADAIRSAESEAHAKEQVELCLAAQDLPEEYTTAIRWMAGRAIESAFAGQPQGHDEERAPEGRTRVIPARHDVFDELAE